MDEADALRESGNEAEAKKQFRLAATAEREAFDGVVPSSDETRGVLAISVVSLLIEAEEFSELNAFAADFVASPNLPAFARVRLDELIANASDRYPGLIAWNVGSEAVGSGASDLDRSARPTRRERGEWSVPRGRSFSGSALLAEKVQRIREVKGMKRAELAAGAKISRAYVTQIEANQAGTLGEGVLRKLADALEVTSDWLLDGEPVSGTSWARLASREALLCFAKRTSMGAEDLDYYMAATRASRPPMTVQAWRALFGQLSQMSETRRHQLGLDRGTN